MAHVLYTLLEVTVGASVLIAVLLLASPRLARRYTAKSLYLVWLVLSVRLLLPVTFNLLPPISIPVPDISVVEAPAGVSSVLPAEMPDMIFPSLPIPDQKQTSNPVDLSSGPALTAGDILVMVWAAGVLAFAGVRMTGYLLLTRRIRRSAAPVTNQAALAAFRAALSDMHIRQDRVALLTYSGTISPMLTGLVRPVILMPEKLVSDTEELALILRHELVHFQQRHIWYKLMLMCVSTIHWFNPLVWAMTREANAQLESACDQEIVRNADFSLRKKYCRSILSAASLGRQQASGLNAGLHGGKQTMKQRFNSIFDQKTKKRGAPLVAVVLLAVLLVSALVSCAETDEPSGTPVSPSPSAMANASPSAEPSDEPSVDPSETAAFVTGSDEESAVRITVAKQWADAVKNRDGKAQYDLMTQELQAKVHDDFSGLNWVTGTSSPWIDGYTLKPTSIGVRVTFHYVTSTGPFGYSSQKLIFTEENGGLKISDITEPDDYNAVSSHIPRSETYLTDFPTAAETSVSLRFLSSLLWMTEVDVKAAFKEEPVAVDEGGLGFEQAGVRVWFDNETHNVSQVLILSNAYDLNGVRLGDSFEDFKPVFGEPVSDQNGEARFRIGYLFIYCDVIRDSVETQADIYSSVSDVYLSVVREIDTGETIAVYILAENERDSLYLTY